MEIIMKNSLLANTIYHNIITQLHQIGRCAFVPGELSYRPINMIQFVFLILKYIITHNHTQSSLKSILIALCIYSSHYFHTMHCDALQCTTISGGSRFSRRGVCTH